MPAAPVSLSAGFAAWSVIGAQFPRWRPLPLGAWRRGPGGRDTEPLAAEALLLLVVVVVAVAVAVVRLRGELLEPPLFHPLDDCGEGHEYRSCSLVDY